MSSCLSLCGSSPFTTDKETVLKGQIQAVASPDDPIRRIMGTFGEGRQQGYALRGAGGQAPLKKPEGLVGVKVLMGEKMV